MISYKSIFTLQFNENNEYYETKRAVNFEGQKVILGHWGFITHVSSAQGIRLCMYKLSL